MSGAGENSDIGFPVWPIQNGAVYIKVGTLTRSWREADVSRGRRAGILIAGEEKVPPMNVQQYVAIFMDVAYHRIWRHGLRQAWFQVAT